MECSIAVSNQVVDAIGDKEADLEVCIAESDTSHVTLSHHYSIDRSTWINMDVLRNTTDCGKVKYKITLGMHW